MSREIGILFKAPMVLAILDGRKTVTRRGHDGRPCRFRVGDRLWVRETWRPVLHRWDSGVEYRADSHYREVEGGKAMDYAQTIGKRSGNPRGIHVDGVPGVDPRFANSTWRPSLLMPRWASRIDLDVVDVRAERLQEIDEADALREGVESREAYARLWDDINGEGSWAANPLVWRIAFGRTA